MWKVGLVGAGYIALHHIKALQALPNVKIAALCDVNPLQIRPLLKTIGHCSHYTQFDEMLKQEQLDVIHLLLPPDLHYPYGIQVLQSGKHLFLEKPMAVSAEECLRLSELAEQKNLKIGVNHNFLFYPVYEEFYSNIIQNKLGPLDHLTITWQKALDQLHAGPFDIWMLRQPSHVILEIGPHLFSPLLNLVQNPESLQVEASDPLLLPNGETVWRRWTAMGQVGKICIDLRLSVSDGFTVHQLDARGRAGSATVDFERNFFILRRHTDYSRPLDLYWMTRSEASQINRGGRHSLIEYIKSKFKLSKFGDPYSYSIAASIGSFYKGLESTIDPRLSSQLALRVIQACEKMASTALKSQEKKSAKPLPNYKVNKKPSILIVGSSGFIGTALTHLLIKHKYPIRLLVRHPGKLDASFFHEEIDIQKGDLCDRAAVQKALEGVTTVFHLARAQVKDWGDYVDQEIETTRLLAEESRKAGVKKFIYTGTIDSYFAGFAKQVITEQTPLDPLIDCRNNYARAKAAEEAILMKMYQDTGFPAVIVRPGIVLGVGSNPFHWGVGMWFYGSICCLWGKGGNPLPFVWVDDVAQGLVSCMETEGIEGESFNLIDDPLLSGKDYVEILGRKMKVAFDVYPTPIWRLYLTDLFKWSIKCLVRHSERKFPAYHDWLSRTQLSKYDCSKAKQVLKWRPLSDKQKLMIEGIEKPAEHWMA